MPGVIQSYYSVHRQVTLDEVDRWLKVPNEWRAVSFYKFQDGVRCCVSSEAGPVRIDAWGNGRTSKEAMEAAIQQLVATFSKREA